MRLTEKENETLPIDVSDFHPDNDNLIFCLPFTTSPEELSL